MNQMPFRAKTLADAHAISAKSDDRLHATALYGAFLMIALIVFGTLSYHPF